jgi:hypothetical protein
LQPMCDLLFGHLHAGSKTTFDDGILQPTISQIRKRHLAAFAALLDGSVGKRSCWSRHVSNGLQNLAVSARSRHGNDLSSRSCVAAFHSAIPGQVSVTGGAFQPGAHAPAAAFVRCHRRPVSVSAQPVAEKPVRRIASVRRRVRICAHGQAVVDVPSIIRLSLTRATYQRK